MVKYKKYLDQFGFPIKKTENYTIKKKYESKILDPKSKKLNLSINRFVSPPMVLLTIMYKSCGNNVNIMKSNHIKH